MNGKPGVPRHRSRGGDPAPASLPVAIFAGWTPPKLPSRAAALPYAWALLCLYGLAPINAVPRMLDASADVVMACTAAGVVPSAAAVALLVRAARFARHPA